MSTDITMLSEGGEPIGPCLSPSTFTLPVSSSNKRYELWSIRVPVDCNVQDIFHGKTLSLTQHRSGSGGHAYDKVVCTMSNDDGEVYALIQGEEAECHSYRILSKVTDANNQDDEEDSSLVEEENKEKEEEKKNRMKPLYKFDRHLNFMQDTCIVQEMLILPQHQVDMKYAPSAELAPEPHTTIAVAGEKQHGGKVKTPQQQQSFRAAYASVSQKSNLKRRWNPPGGSSAVAVMQQDVTATITSPSSNKKLKAVKVESTPETKEKKEKKHKKSDKKEKKKRKSDTK